MKKIYRWNLKALKTLIRIIIPFHKRLAIFWKLRMFKISLTTPLITERKKYEADLAEEFNIFFTTNQPDDINRTIESLKRNLDENSLKEVDNFLYRQTYTFQHNFIERKKIFTDSELSTQKDCSKIIDQARKKFSKYKFKQIEPEVFYSFCGLRWLPEKIQKKLIGGNFVDLGAYDGDSAVMLADQFKAKLIWAFEPEPENFKALKKTAEKFGQQIIQPLCHGAGEKTKQANIDSDGRASSISLAQTGQEISIISLDEFFKQQKENKKIDLIKMDIEGSELNALIGASNIIKMYRPTLSISIYHHRADFFNIKPWLETICPDYKFLIKKAQPFELSRETVLLAYTEED